MYHNDIFFKCIVNYAFDVKYDLLDRPYHFKLIKGYGIGMTLLSPVGPLEIILSRGDKDWQEGNKMQTLVYFVMGYRF
jgi:NTE family protein